MLSVLEKGWLIRQVVIDHNAHGDMDTCECEMHCRCGLNQRE